MNKLSYWLLLFILITGASFVHQPKEPWRPDQLMAPADLAKSIDHATEKPPLIICVGPAGLIKGSVETGQTRDKAGITNLKKVLAKEKKDREIVIYCGCCPFKDCPNIRPAFSLLNAMHFTNHKLLNLPHNLRVDWINHGYPVNKTK